MKLKGVIVASERLEPVTVSITNGESGEKTLHLYGIDAVTIQGVIEEVFGVKTQKAKRPYKRVAVNWEENPLPKRGRPRKVKTEEMEPAKSLKA